MVILLTADHQTLVDYLTDCRCDVSKLTSLSLSDNDAHLGGEISTGISVEEQIARNNEAKTLVLTHLQKCGFDISNISTAASVISGVKRDGIEYPLVVKSCPNKEHRVFINPDEWRQLFKQNSMLWLHFGNGVVAPIKAYELFTYQDKLTLSFDTINIMMDNRVKKIMEVMHYFNNVHLNLATLNPDTHRGEQLKDYLFNDTNMDNNSFETGSID